MTNGTVKWYNATKGYGFIEPENGEKDAFVHRSALEKAGINSLNDGQKVSYELVTGSNGKESADNIQLRDQSEGRQRARHREQRKGVSGQHPASGLVRR